MLKNGSFDLWTNGIPDGWTVEQGSVAQFSGYRSTYALMFTSAKIANYIVSSPMTLQPGLAYKLEFNVYGNVSNWVDFYVQYTSDGIEWEDFAVSKYVNFVNAWDARSFVFVVPNDALQVRIRIYAYYNGAVILDNIAVDKVPTHTVSFDSNGGSEVAPQEVADGFTAIKPKDPILPGYEFAGWDFDFDTPITEDITIYAKEWINLYMTHVSLPMSKGYVELSTAGMYCRSNIIVTADGAGDDHTLEDVFVSRQFSETSYTNDRVAKVGTGAFYGVDTLTEANFPNAASVEDSAFRGCHNLKAVNIQNAISIGTEAFMGCENLVSVKADKTQTIYPYAFEMCMSLFTLDLPEVTSLYFGALHGCFQLYELILRNSNVVCSLGDQNALEYTPIQNGIGYIYVPRALLSNYKTASNWSLYSAQFRAIEDYPDICG